MSSFFSPYRHQFIRVGACVPAVTPAEPAPESKEPEQPNPPKNDPIESF